MSESSAFAILATSHGPGTRGIYELVDDKGHVLRDGSCRIIFQRQGAGIGLSLLAKPPLRRSSKPANARSGPVAVPKLDPLTVPKLDGLPKLDPPGPTEDTATKRTLPGKSLEEDTNVTQQFKRASTPSDAPQALHDEDDDAPEMILGSVPPPPQNRVAKPQVPESPEIRSDWPSVEDAELSDVKDDIVQSALSPDVSGIPAALAPTDPAPFDIEKGERPPNVHVSFPPIGKSRPDDPAEETPHSSAETEPPPPLFELPELPKWDPPPPSEPPPRYDPGSWKAPVYEPGALDMGSNPALTPYPKEALTQDSPPPQSDASELSNATTQSFKAPASRPPSDPAPSAASQSKRKARVATRAAGTGARGLAIGIDLGTSNTCASAMIDGVPQIIPTRFGNNTVPSVLTVIDSRVVVGHAAAKRMIMNPHETIYGSKRLVGRAFTAEVADEYQTSFAYPLVETEDHRFGASLKGRVISFEQVAEYLLAEVRDVAERHLEQKVHSAVITVPAYFGEAQREAIRRAARGAQLSVDRIVPEPTAAAVAYGYDAELEHTLVVFDLGGGTFDVSVLKVGKDRFEVLATGGDAFLGGIDIDDLIASYLIEEFQRAERTTLEPSAQQLARLRDAAEIAKRDLSVQKRVAISLPHFAVVGGEPKALRATLSRETFDELAASFVDRLIVITAATLSDCGLAPHDIDDVLLVGGMTRMALVPQRVEELFGRRPSRRINPDEAVALGAARLAESGGKVKLLDVLPLSIGVASRGRAFQRLVTRNTQVPVERSFSVRTEEADQAVYRLPLFQGEHPDAADNEYLGTLMIEEIPPGPAGSELELLLVLDEQCFLEVRAAHVASGNGLAVYVNREEGAEKAIAALDSYAGPKKETKKKEAKGLGRFFQRLRSFFS
ncbi:MAG: Hsp70 family protein [Polyangiales bacterium]